MPTTRPRHVITETPEVAAGLDAGQRRWPGLSRGKVASLLVAEAGRGADGERAERTARRRDALHDPPSAVTAWHPDGYLEDLRQDWQD